MKNYNITPELIAQAEKAKTTDELMELAKKNNLELTEQDATEFLEALKNTKKEGALADDELDNVAGGGGCEESGWKVPDCPDFYGSSDSNKIKYSGTCGTCANWMKNMSSANPDKCKYDNPRFKSPL